MRKILILSCFMLLTVLAVTPVFAITLESVDATQASDHSADLSISGAGVIYTESMEFKSGVYYSVSYLANSASSTPDITITVEQSFQRPTTEGAADSTYAVPEGFTAIYTNLIDEAWRHERLLAIPLKFGRYKITGNVGNATDVIANIKTSIQEMTN